MCVILFYYPLMQRPFEALAATLVLHPAASACCCCGIVTATVTTTTPSIASAATIAIIAMDVVDDPSSRDEPTICS
jgi:hypothetical protein